MTTNLQYEDLLYRVNSVPLNRDDRTGTGTRSVFGAQLRYDLSQGFPICTTKYVPFRLVVTELLWMLSGSTNVRPLQAQNNHIWDEWADTEGNLGPVYGQQWRSWAGQQGPIDQISEVIDQIMRNPTSRRLMVSAWNVDDIPKMKLPPCHALFQFYVHQGKLSCQLYQRSANMFLGVPFNIASYALLTHMIARHCALTVGDFIWTGGDCHIYLNHVDQVKLQLGRTAFPPPTLEFDRRPTIFDYQPQDFKLMGYHHHDAIEGEVSI